jgi:hypothetical protein
MANQIYITTGQVIDRDTSEGVVGLSIEAWDNDLQRAQKLGDAKTDDNGRFSISFDLRQFNYETAPDLFFKVFHDDKLLESTESSVLWNANTQESVTIKIRTTRERAPGKDRITSTQVFKGVDFFQKSDFEGVFNDYRTKAGTSLGLFADILKNTFTKMDLKPIQVKGSRQTDVVNQDVNVARTNLASKNITVKEVVPYQPGLKESLQSISLIPKNIQPGQEVKLYVENEKVRYYSIVTPSASATLPGDVTKNLEEHANQLNSMQQELKTAREDSAKKDEIINSLQQQIATLQKSQTEVDTLLKSDNFKRMITEINKPDIPKTGTIKEPKKPK